jgi:AhpD family alkylhydroperoxidase
MAKLPKFYLRFKQDHGRVWKAYEKLGAAAAEDGPLDAKTRELIKLGMTAAAKSESALQSHVHRALEAGATPDEIRHALILGVTTLGFPAMMTALAWAQAALDAHTEE